MCTDRLTFKANDHEYRGHVACPVLIQHPKSEVVPSRFCQQQLSTRLRTAGAWMALGNQLVPSLLTVPDAEGELAHSSGCQQK